MSVGPPGIKQTRAPIWAIAILYYQFLSSSRGSTTLAASATLRLNYSQLLPEIEMIKKRGYGFNKQKRKRKKNGSSGCKFTSKITPLFTGSQIDHALTQEDKKTIFVYRCSPCVPPPTHVYPAALQRSPSAPLHTHSFKTDKAALKEARGDVTPFPTLAMREYFACNMQY